MRKLKGIFLAALIWFAAKNSTAQCPVNNNWIIDNFTAEVNSLKIKFVEKSKKDTVYLGITDKLKELSTIIDNIYSNADELFIIGFQGDTSAQMETVLCNYQREIADYATILTNVNLDSLKKINYTLSFISDDLQSKLISYNKLPGNRMATAFARPRKVRIKVVDEKDQELAGYEPFLKPEMSLSSFSIVRFNPTNDAERDDITTGRKKIWIEKDGRFIKETTETITKGLDTQVVKISLNLKERK